MTILLTAIQSILPILLIISLGYELQKLGWFSDDFMATLSRFILNIALPAGIFSSVLQNLTVKGILGLVDRFVLTFMSYGLLYLLGFVAIFIFKVRPGRRGTLVNTFANPNAIFIGLPLNTALFGNKALPYFLIFYITNTISTWTIGATLMLQDSMERGQKQRVKLSWKNLFPIPLLGFMVAIGFLFLRIPTPHFLLQSFTYLGNTVTPLSLIYIGAVLATSGLGSVKIEKDSLLALGGRFLLGPLSMYLVLTFFGSQLSATEYKTYIVQSATPALTVLPILASQGYGDRDFSVNVVTLTTLVFIFVIPILVLLLG